MSARVRARDRPRAQRSSRPGGPPLAAPASDAGARGRRAGRPHPALPFAHGG